MSLEEVEVSDLRHKFLRRIDTNVDACWHTISSRALQSMTRSMALPKELAWFDSNKQLEIFDVLGLPTYLARLDLDPRLQLLLHWAMQCCLEINSSWGPDLIQINITIWRHGYNKLHRFLLRHRSWIKQQKHWLTFYVNPTIKDESGFLQISVTANSRGSSLHDFPQNWSWVQTRRCWGHYTNQRRLKFYSLSWHFGCDLQLRCSFHMTASSLADVIQ